MYAIHLRQQLSLTEDLNQNMVYTFHILIFTQFLIVLKANCIVYNMASIYRLLSSWSLDTIIVLYQAAMVEDSMTSHENALLDIQKNAYNNR